MSKNPLLKVFKNQLFHSILYIRVYLFLLWLIILIPVISVKAQVIPSTGLKVHLRSDAVVTASGSSVSQWTDLSGNNNNAVQSAGIYQPALVNASLNGLPVIRFNNSILELPTSTTLGIQNNDYEIFFVARSSSSATQFLISGAFENFELHLNGASGARFIPIRIPDPNQVYLDLSPTGTFTDGNAHIFSGRASSSGGEVRVDGVDGETIGTNITSSDASTLLLGARTGGSLFLIGDIAEVILYNRVLDASERNTVEQYLANRYNITSGSLPVELVSFTANVNGNSVCLNWQTATEQNNYGFEVLRSYPALDKPACPVGREGAGGGWTTLGFVEGNGNSNAPKEYSFIDTNPIQGNAQYRLKQIDLDGNYKYYSQTAEVNFSMTDVKENLIPKEFGLSQNYPNPFNPTTVISYQLPVISNVILKVYDMLGNEISTLVNEYKQPGYHTIEFNGSNLSSGIYFYQIKTDQFSATRKLVLIR